MPFLSSMLGAFGGNVRGKKKKGSAAAMGAAMGAMPNNRLGNTATNMGLAKMLTPQAMQQPSGWASKMGQMGGRMGVPVRGGSLGGGGFMGLPPGAQAGGGMGGGGFTGMPAAQQQPQAMPQQLMPDMNQYGGYMGGGGWGY